MKRFINEIDGVSGDEMRDPCTGSIGVSSSKMNLPAIYLPIALAVDSGEKSAVVGRTTQW